MCNFSIFVNIFGVFYYRFDYWIFMGGLILRVSFFKGIVKFCSIKFFIGKIVIIIGVNICVGF